VELERLLGRKYCQLFGEVNIVGQLFGEVNIVVEEQVQYLFKLFREVFFTQRFPFDKIIFSDI